MPNQRKNRSDKHNKLNIKQHSLICCVALNDAIVLVVSLVGLKNCGAVTVVLLNGLSLITSALIEKFLFKKQWFCVDYSAILLCLIGVTCLFISKTDFSGNKTHSTDNKYFIGIFFLVITEIVQKIVDFYLALVTYIRIIL